MDTTELEKQTKKVMVILYPVWPKGELAPEAITAYSMAFRGMDFGLLQAAAAEWIATEKWFPKPAELINLAYDLAEDKYAHAVRSLPAVMKPEHINTADDYERALRVAKLAVEMGINLHPTVMNLVREAQP